ncbi:MAG: hypothetical protein QOD72_975, partial [Acidimicrobiaceae bacterium]|nr:hypothetical protein [Acidimicrobiaceae bacterium]
MADVVTWRTALPNVWLVTIERGPANALHPEILQGLHAAIDAADAAGDVKVMVVSSAHEGFIAAGADIKPLATINVDAFTVHGDARRAVNARIAAAPWVSI